ncbi:MAG TPA: nitroreductase family deazaflavin-dependent oxidoreductase [Solirubrobacterales bacterium]|nr:nitroreductase family deazaflavin-dependent oxidoreductase [Solirubrobacterales bacterium]
MGYLDLADRTWPLLSRAMGLHTLAYRATRGLVGHRIPGLGAPILLLEHVGAKSGRRRTTPLLYIRDGDNVAVIASKGGFPRHPAWFHNLRAHPEVEIQVGSERRAVRARVAAGAERERLWRQAVEHYRPYADYQARTDREIPVVVLEPR